MSYFKNSYEYYKMDWKTKTSSNKKIEFHVNTGYMSIIYRARHTQHNTKSISPHGGTDRW